MNFDKALVERILQKDEFAFAEFYQKTVDDFFRYVISHYSLTEAEVNDIVSDVYLKIREWIDKYDTKFLFWQFVRSILKNHCKDYFKKQKPLLFSHIEQEQEDTNTSRYTLDEGEDFGQLFNFSIDNVVLQKTLATLDQNTQELLHARFVLWYSYEVLSDMFMLSEDTIRQQISRILKKLKTLLWHTRD